MTGGTIITMGKIGISFVAGVKYRENVYALAREVNGLFRLDLSTKELTYLRKISKYKGCRAEYMNAFLYRNEAWFVPGYSDNIAIVNLDTLEVSYRKIPFKKINKRAMSSCNGIFSSFYLTGEIIGGRFLYLVPKNIDALLVIDLETKKFYPYYDVVDVFGARVNAAYGNGNIYLLPENGNVLSVINLETKRTRQYSLQAFYKEYTGIVFYSNKLWFIPQCTEYILSIDLNTRKMERVLMDRYHNERGGYYQYFMNDNELFGIPYSGDKMFKFNMDNKQFSEIPLKGGVLERGNMRLRKLFSGDKIILDCVSKSMILVYDSRQEYIFSIGLSIRKSDIAPNFEKNFVGLEHSLYNEYFTENFCGIENLLKIMEKRSLKEKSALESKGKIIWEYVKE